MITKRSILNYAAGRNGRSGVKLQTLPPMPGVPYDAALAAAGGLVAVRYRGELRLVTFDERNELQREADALLGYHQTLARE